MSGIDMTDIPKLLLADCWDDSIDPRGWWMSEKLDGVRAWWDGRRFLSRQGNVYQAPDWFTAGLPDVPLDGELWLDRRAFQRTVSIVRRQCGQGDRWREIKYVAFDAPGVGPFEERQRFLKDMLQERQARFAGVLCQTRCADAAALAAELARIESLGGEGLMLRQPGSRYEPGRSATLLKVKTSRDAEGRVVEHLAGRGRNAAWMGAVVVELPDGQTFSLGTGFSDAQRQDPPPIGSVVTYSYQELTDRGVPRFASFVRVRSDVDAGRPGD